MRNFFSIALVGLASGTSLVPTADIQFDGHRLGDGYLEKFVTTPAYQNPCDIDPINDGKRSVVFFTGKPCKGKSFPQSTTVVMFTSGVFSEENPNPPVSAIAWMGGNYFDSHSNFPLTMGASEDLVVRTLGEALETQTVPGPENKSLIIRRHPENTFSLILGGKAVGYAVGELPPIDLESEENEEWGGIAAGYFRFTPAPPTGETPTQPGTPPADSVDPRAQLLLNSFFEALLITDNEDARFNAVVPTVHRSLLNRDRSDFAPGIRDYAYRRACREVELFQYPVKVVRVRRGTTTAIGVGPDKEIGRVDKYYVEAKPQHQGTVSPAPLHVFFPQDGSAPTISNFGSL